jgi:hypothetical protein
MITVFELLEFQVMRVLTEARLPHQSSFGTHHPEVAARLLHKVRTQVIRLIIGFVDVLEKAPSAGHRGVEVPAGGSLYHVKHTRRRSLVSTEKAEDGHYAVGSSVQVDRS